MITCKPEEASRYYCPMMSKRCASDQCMAWVVIPPPAADDHPQEKKPGRPAKVAHVAIGEHAPTGYCGMVNK